ncbi:MAG: tRNA 4-thiouridine(8) synthase ThiI [Clostridia bacterium]|nr:tRNA 4-thiouridine(8) synthase ThiI [Clostridia bacterium]
MSEFREVILCKYGELVLKGANLSFFESLLVKEMKARARRHGKFNIYHVQSTLYIEPLEEDCDLDGMLASARRVFGIVGITRAAVAEKNMEDILRVAKGYLPAQMVGKRTFRVDAKRADKKFPLPSPEIAGEVGGALLSVNPKWKVDLHEPDCRIRVEIRETAAYIHADQEKGAGGMPIRSNGRGLLLLSGGIDSPVAGYMMAKRGVEIEALHFESFPYTSERAKEKVMQLASELCEYCTKIHVHVISLTHIQEELRDKCEEDYFTLLLRRFMMTLAERCARTYKCGALITGESLGQVASQTMEALNVTNEVVNIPVFRPCIGMDKEEIVQIARQIGTFETSILPYEDCCTVFTPRHPRTRPVLEKVLAQQAKVDFDALVEEAWNTMYTETCTLKEER